VPDVKHKFTSAVGDGGDATLVRPSNWNDLHVWPTNTTLGDLRLMTGDFAIHLYEVAVTGEVALEGTAELTVAGWKDDGLSYNVLGTPRAPSFPFRIPNGYDYKEIDELGLVFEIEGFIEGSGELYLANFNDSSELVVSGRT
jgi:hypothetical protein